ncbi:MAG TPA: NADH:flavin oxidoreductase/NADH oxidase [Rhodospirillales bacterium]|nr:NADH:flavin oxidoreductase/NADH oxidase [Rhodospirillales bacterium]
MASHLFSSFSMRELTLSNRVTVSPMCQYGAEDGSANDWHLMHLGNLAISGFGLVITEATGVEARGRISPGCLGLYSDANEQALARVVGFCKHHGNTALGIQLAHAGRKASTHVPWKGRGPAGEDAGGWPIVAPSAVALDDDHAVPEALDEAGMAEVVQAFVQAARRADRLGFDLIEVHGAHGYLLHEFLSPISNHRDDAYGGERENRVRFPLEVFAAVREAWPDDKPLGIRISASDHIEGGWSLDDSVTFAGALKGLGCDYIDVSSAGVAPDRQKITVGPGYQVPFSARIRKEARIPTMAVGMITRPHQAEAIIAEGKADLVALARGVLYDPRWVWHAAEALGAEAAYPVPYERSRPALWPEAFAEETE